MNWHRIQDFAAGCVVYATILLIVLLAMEAASQ